MLLWDYSIIIEIEYKCKVEHMLICEIRVNMWWWIPQFQDEAPRNLKWFKACKFSAMVHSKKLGRTEPNGSAGWWRTSLLCAHKDLAFILVPGLLRRKSSPSWREGLRIPLMLRGKLMILLLFAIESHFRSGRVVRIGMIGEPIVMLIMALELWD